MRAISIARVSHWIQSSPAAWNSCYKVLGVLVMGHLSAQLWWALPSAGPESSWKPTLWQTARRLYLAQIALTSFSAVLSLHVQIRGLVGTNGIIPFPHYAAERIRRHSPDVCLLSMESALSEPARWAARCLNVLESRWWAHGCRSFVPHSDTSQGCRAQTKDWWRMESCGLTDDKLINLCRVGEAASLLVLFLSLAESNVLGCGLLGVSFQITLGALRVVSLLVATICYRALRGCAGVFTALQWDSLVIEANMLALPLALPLLPNCWLPALLLPQQVCAFKCMFGSGVVKRRSRCPRWASSTAMDLHYETQPLPHLLSWFAHRLPHSLHAWECAIAFVVQLPLTFLQWGTWHCRLVAFLGYASLMVAIASTGNYGFFNLQVLGLSMSMLDDSLLPVALPTVCELPWQMALPLLPAAVALGAYVGAACGASILQLPRLGGAGVMDPGSIAEKAVNMVQLAQHALHPIGIGHSYGPFAGMTTFRWELIFDLSFDGETWNQLEFPYKPGCVNTAPQWMPLGHFARLDWRLWFVPLAMARGQWELPDWVENFIAQLLRGSEPVAALTQHRDAIAAVPPKFIRVSVWDYHFSSCDPTVHQCPQVAFTRGERDAAYAVMKASPTLRKMPSKAEWGSWWYRQLVRQCGIYFIQDGQLQFFTEEDTYRYQN
eukprot:TRINITY_DN27483_c0_g1_i1.p1 TRINITY_DN27483_c0_g1~~TRINITY_DN27483_c0_g1_i1.p1  ORF type:complete len:693 (+),score=108.19 TRINITY_DN27483_c0_g1_i1:93-2081(+)